MENEQKQQEQEIDLIELFCKVVVHWGWFLMAIAVALTDAHVYIYITTPVYQASASVVIKGSEGSDKATNDPFNQVSPSSMAATNTQIEDELEMLRSRSILSQVIDELSMHTTYRIKEGLGYTEIATPPISVTLEKTATDTLQEALLIRIERIGDHYEARSTLHDICLTESFTTFLATIKTLAGLCTLELLPNRTSGRIVKVDIRRPTDAANHYLQKPTVTTTSKKTSIVGPTFKDTDKKRAEASLIRLAEAYNRNAMNDKDKVTGDTLIFLEERLGSISRELESIEKHLEQYKEEEKPIDLKTNIDLDLNTNNEYEKKLLEVKAQLNVTTYIYDYLKDEQHHSSLLPVNAGISDMELMRLINEYNKRLLGREHLLNIMKPDNPTVVNQNMNITALRKNASSSVTGVKEGLEIVREDITHKTNYFNSYIDDMFKQERGFNNIDRQQQIKANLYLMLLGRRERITTSLVVTINRTRVVDAPLTANAPIAPKSPMIYAGSLSMACIMTIALILSKDMFRTKISLVLRVEVIQLLIVETIPLDKEQISMTKGKNGLMEESSRRLRSNLCFLMEKRDEKRIPVTSPASGEGKSFTNINLAPSFAFLGCRVLIVGLDIRRPRLAEYLHIQNRQGITNFLAGSRMRPEDIIYPPEVHKLLSAVPSGPAPSNLAELLERKRLKDAFTYPREHFDYVIVDSAPTSLASDTLSLSKMMDFALYVCRINYTYGNVLPEIVNTGRTGRLNHILLIVNGGSLSEKECGYGYRYGHTH